MLYTFFWVIPRRLNFICRRFGTLCLFDLHRRIDMILHLSAYEDGTECSEKSVYRIQKPGNHTEESTQHTEHGESLKPRIQKYIFYSLFHVIFCYKVPKYVFRACICRISRNALHPLTL